MTPATDQKPVEPSSIATPCKCKVCGSVVGYLAGNAMPEQTAQLFAKMSEHFHEAAQPVIWPANVDPPNRNNVKPMPKTGALRDLAARHQSALMGAVLIGGNCTIAMLAQYFELPAGAEAYREQARYQVHHFTRRVRTTDAEIEAMANKIDDQIDHRSDTGIELWIEALKQLRDKYEEGFQSPQETKP
jgi:hypothetical protein